jgi:hypothetical protein
MSDIFGIGQGVSGVAQSAATVAAAGIQADAINNATDAQRDAFNTITTNNKPFLNTGTSALGQLATLYGLNSGGGSTPAAANTNTPQTTMTWADGTPGAPGITNTLTGLYQQNGYLLPAAPVPNGTGTSGSANASGNDPYATFYQSPDYQFRFGQGIKGVDAGAAARGMLDSGATRKAEIGYAGNLAAGEFGTYANRLQALAGIGQAAASNQASAAQGYANNIGNLAAAGANNWGNAINNVAGQFKSSYPGSNGGGGSYSGFTPSLGGGNSGFGTGYAGSGLYQDGMFIG